MKQEEYNKIMEWIERNENSGYVTEIGLKKLINKLMGESKDE